MKLAIGFLTYNENSSRYLSDFLPSLELALSFLSPEEYIILAFDNSAADHQANRLALEAFTIGQRRLEYISVGENLGFARAGNILINKARQMQAEYFLLLNPDMIIEPESIKLLVAALDQEPRLAAVAPKILRWDFSTNTKTKEIDSAGLVLRTGLSFKDLGQGEKDGKQYDRSEIIGPSGAAGLFRLSVLDKIRVENAYFDEKFFMYKEDCDLAYRLQLAGLPARLTPSAIFYHDRTAASSGLGLWRAIVDRSRKSREVRIWSHYNQHLLYLKYWKNQNFVNKIFVLARVLGIFIFSLILEQFILKNYLSLCRELKILTNIK